MKKVLLVVLAVGLWLPAGAASAHPGRERLAFTASGWGTGEETGLSSTASGPASGRFIADGQIAVSQGISGFPPPCGSGNATAGGSLVLTASNGDQLFEQETQEVCQSDSALSYPGRGTYTIVGGTGRFEGATGAGTFADLAVFPTTSPLGSFMWRFAETGTIHFVRNRR